ERGRRGGKHRVAGARTAGADQRGECVASRTCGGTERTHRARRRPYGARTSFGAGESSGGGRELVSCRRTRNSGNCPPERLGGSSGGRHPGTLAERGTA